MGTLWRALLEGFGWHVGRAAAEEALEHAERALPPEPTPPDPKAAERERREQEKARARAAKEQAAAAKREEKAIDAELAELKKRIR